MSSAGTGLGFRVDGASTEINGGDPWLRYNSTSNDWRIGWYNGTEVYFARITGAEANYPDAVKTGDVHINRLRFFNICENGDEGVSALAGCVFDEKYPLAFIVCVEEGGYGAAACLPIASSVLKACTEAMKVSG